MEKTKQKDTKKGLRYDLILIISLLVLSLVAVGILLATRKTGEYAVVEINGETVARYALNIDGEYTLNGGTNKLIIEDGYAYMTYADCPDGTCIKTGKIRYNGESITCLPNRVNIYITGEGGLDLVS